jgi:hypothetical protein
VLRGPAPFLLTRAQPQRGRAKQRYVFERDLPAQERARQARGVIEEAIAKLCAAKIKGVENGLRSAKGCR